MRLFAFLLYCTDAQEVLHCEPLHCQPQVNLPLSCQVNPILPILSTPFLPKHDDATSSQSSSNRTKQTFGQQVAVTAELTAHCLAQTLWERLYNFLDADVKFIEDSLEFVGNAAFFAAKTLDEAARWLAKQPGFQAIAKSPLVRNIVAKVKEVRGERRKYDAPVEIGRGGGDGMRSP